MLVNYCGGWGYYKWVKQLKSEVEIRVPNAYAYQFERDKGMTGRFEVTVFPTADDLKNQTNGTVLHSKKNTKKFPWDLEKEAFYENIKNHSVAVKPVEGETNQVAWWKMKTIKISNIWQQQNIYKKSFKIRPRLFKEKNMTNQKVKNFKLFDLE